MLRSCTLLAASLLACGFSFAQKPYFQQKVDTRIEVTLDDVKHFLHGFEEFTYINNSPDTLRQIFVHLWANAYSHDRTAFSEAALEDGKTDFYYSKPAQRGYIDSLRFRVDGAAANPAASDGVSPEEAEGHGHNPAQGQRKRLEERERQAKIIEFLQRRGFNYSTAKAVLQRLEEVEEE